MSIDEEIKLYFINNNLRKAEKKIMVATYLKNFDQAVPAKTLWLLIRKDRKDLCIGSVYQALNWLVETGFADKISGDRTFLYSLKKPTTPPLNKLLIHSF
ncbi:hypothetical protein [Dyadobacter psychrotolerans]|uniref:Ferric uptake regulator family protein n=1 Tax=Dyadobacter psychrotolerans TaxID=2541721 RepID=A0A4R5DKY6_9BACT|nr:hypothetical protein [Dyadobacter psychrotolerans]TDE11293.1 hypothetical protein E0F88_25615 [Dyadobacter psychrotolerans]